MYGVSWFVGYFIRIIRLLVGFVVLGFREPKYSERWGVVRTDQPVWSCHVPSGRGRCGVPWTISAAIFPRKSAWVQRALR
jgi:hypothetical protein